MSRRFYIRRISAWHPAFVCLVESNLQDGYELRSEFHLGRYPQRIDVLIIRQDDKPEGVPRRLLSLLTRLFPHTLIEFKGPTDRLEAQDVPALLSYGWRYLHQQGLSDFGSVRLIWLADSLTGPFKLACERSGASLNQTDPGVWEGQVGGLSAVVIEASVVFKTHPHTEYLLHLFTSQGITDASLAQGLDAEDYELYNLMCSYVIQRSVKVGGIDMRDLEKFQGQSDRNFALLQDKVLANMSIEQRLRGLSPIELRERVLADMSVEERLEGLAPRERLEGLAPRERL